MTQPEADSPSTTRSCRIARCRAAGGVVLAVALAVIALGVAGCTTPASSQTSSAEPSATVIATAPAVPATLPAVLEPHFPPSMAGYKLVFNDEFRGPAVTDRRWTTSLPWGNTNTDELQYYTPAALSQSNGVLTITASQQPLNGEPYQSGVISSADRFQFVYGYAEIRAQIPAGDGLWSAFWLLSPVHSSNEEVDVLEILGQDPSLGYAVLHFWTAIDKGKWLGTYRNPDFSVGFHTFGVDWEPDHMAWYVDGVERYRVTQNIPSSPMFIVTNLAVGGPQSWSGAPNRFTVFPAQLKVDYIRVFQRK